MIFVLFFFGWLSDFAMARPEYAARVKSSCISCHISPWGAGARNKTGKIFGSRGLTKTRKILNADYSLDMRIIMSSGKTGSKNSQTTNTTSTKRKNGIMTTQLGVNKEFLDDYKIVANYDFGSFASKIRDTYLLLEKETYSVLAGQFYLPFGLLTDEHRTYTKMITASGFRDYETGAVLTKSLGEYLSLDLGTFKGFSSLNQQGSESGQVLNLRYLFKEYSALVGGSYVKHNSEEVSPDAYALYGIYSFDKYFTGSLAFEYVVANNFNRIDINSRYIPRIIPGDLIGTYSREIQDETANASQIEFKYEFNNNLILLYKYDYLVLDQNQRAESMTRHAFGFRYQPLYNFSVLVKYELANVSLPKYTSGDYTVTESEGPVIMLRGWF
jgi:hypothetical protein